MTDLLPSALSWYDDAAASVIPAAGDRPAATDSKQPWPDGPSWTRYQSERPSRRQTEKWFRPGGGYDGFGVVCGAVSGGLELFELEGLGIREGRLAALENALADHGLRDLWQRIISGYTEATPSGGMHTFYKVQGAARPNTKLAARPAREDELTEEERAILATHPGKVFPRLWIETRGEGGFAVVAPSGGTVHPTGKPWVLSRGGPATIATITEDERDALYAIATLLNEMPRFSQPRQSRPSSGAQDGGRPGDEFAARATWKDILAPHGWEEIRSLGAGVRWWRRPGKDKGMSATTRDGGGLWVFTTSTELDANSTLEAGRDKGYSKFAAYTVLNHRGDYTAAAAQLRREGYGADQDSADSGEAHDEAEKFDNKKRLVVLVTGRNPVDVADDVAEHILKANKPPELFSMDPAAVLLRKGILVPLDDPGWLLYVARRVTFIVKTKNGTMPVAPPAAVMKLIPPVVIPELPPLDGIATTPYFDRDGNLIHHDGYHPGTRRLGLDRCGGLRGPSSKFLYTRNERCPSG